MFFRLGMMGRTWGTAPSVRGSSWSCGWKEWSLQWPLLTWGSKPPLRQKHFLSIWSWGLLHRTLLRSKWERELKSNPNNFSLINRCVSPSVSQRSEGGAVKLHVQRALCRCQTNTFFNWGFIVWISQRHYRWANKIRKLWKEADNWMIHNTHTHIHTLLHSRPLPAQCVFITKHTANVKNINLLKHIWFWQPR